MTTYQNFSGTYMNSENRLSSVTSPENQTPSKANRRSSLKTGALALGAGLLAGCGEKKTIQTARSNKKFRWRLAMIVPKTLPLWGEGIIKFAKTVKEMSEGRLDIKVHGAGELFPAYDVFDRVRAGQIQMGHSAAYCWQGKIRSAVFFTSIPFGLNASGMNAWLKSGGQELWDELYAPYGVKALPCGNTGVQMGGWFNKKMNNMNDFQGLKMRMPGLGGKVIAKAGAQPIDIPGGEILTSLQTGVIDATEWIGPYHDQIMGFHKAAKYYYSGGWHEPGSVLELIINQKAWNELPKDLQLMVKAAASQTNADLYAEWGYRDAIAFEEIKNSPNVEICSYPAEITKTMKKHSEDVISELISNDPLGNKIYKSLSSFQKKYQAYQDVSEIAYAKSVRS
jgi:TRAP-type mannitol/chloroaromatic compound transport system substrate-binding protein